MACGRKVSFLKGQVGPLERSVWLGILTVNIKERDSSLTAYEFYWEDWDGRPHFFGVLPERRKKPERITQESIMNWGEMVMGQKEGIKKIFFVKVEE